MLAVQVPLFPPPFTPEHVHSHFFVVAFVVTTEAVPTLQREAPVGDLRECPPFIEPHTPLNGGDNLVAVHMASVPPYNPKHDHTELPPAGGKFTSEGVPAEQSVSEPKLVSEAA